MKLLDRDWLQFGICNHYQIMAVVVFLFSVLQILPMNSYYDEKA